MDIQDKLRKIEALIARTSSEGERMAAQLAKERLERKIDEHPIEYTVSSHSYWEKRLFLAICKKYGFIGYRYARQKRTTTMVRVTKTIMDTVLWPEYTYYSELLKEAVDDIANDLINKIHQVVDEEVVIAGEIGSACGI